MTTWLIVLFLFCSYILGFIILYFVLKRQLRPNTSSPSTSSEPTTQMPTLINASSSIPPEYSFSDKGISRPINEKLRDWVSVKDFGAKGDNATDDSDAIQSAINNANSVFFPQGVYRVKKTIYLRNGIGLFGVDGGKSNVDTSMNWHTKLIFDANNGAGTACFTIPSSENQIKFCSFFGLSFICNSSSYDWIFDFPRMASCSFLNIIALHSVLGKGVLRSRCGQTGCNNWINDFTNCSFTCKDGSDQYVMDHDFSDSYITACYFTGGKGVRDVASGGNLYIGCHFDRVKFSSGEYAGITFLRNNFYHSTSSTKHCVLVGCYLDENDRYGVIVDSSNVASNDTYVKLTISACTFRGTSSNYRSDIYFKSGSSYRIKGVSVTGCSMTGGTAPPFSWDVPSNWSKSSFIGNVSSGGSSSFINSSNDNNIIIDPEWGSLLGDVKLRSLNLMGKSQPPSSPVVGDVYFNTSTNQLCFYKASGWSCLN